MPSYSDKVVPVEAGGGPGTALAHWRESVMTNELMTGYINLGKNPLSLVTIAHEGADRAARDREPVRHDRGHPTETGPLSRLLTRRALNRAGGATRPESWP